MGRFPYYSMGGGEHKNEVIETDESIDLLRLESDGARYNTIITIYYYYYPMDIIPLLYPS